MQQSNVIFGALLIAYIVYITAKGELSTYITLLRGGGAEATGGTTSGNSSPLGALTPLTPVGNLIDPGQIIQGDFAVPSGIGGF